MKDSNNYNVYVPKWLFLYTFIISMLLYHPYTAHHCCNNRSTLKNLNHIHQSCHWCNVNVDIRLYETPAIF